MAQLIAQLRRRLTQVASTSQDLIKNISLVLGSPRKKLTRKDFMEMVDSLDIHATPESMTKAFETFPHTTDGCIAMQSFCAVIFPNAARGRTGGSRAEAQPVPDMPDRSAAVRRKNAITDPKKLLAQLEQKMTRNVSGVARAYRQFRSLARSSNGDIDMAGFRTAVERLSIVATKDCCDTLFRKLDPNGDGLLDLNEFIKGILQTAGHTTTKSGSGQGQGRRGQVKAVSFTSSLRFAIRNSHWHWY